ncbi:MAG: tryptophanase [Patescibacteria group bacterium]
MELYPWIKELAKKNTVTDRPYFNHSVRMKSSATPRERMLALEKAGLNVFNYPSQMVTGCDLLSDSGTTTMTATQWAVLMLGDEAYGSNEGYFKLADVIKGIFGSQFFNTRSPNINNAFLFHQGRAAENALFSILGKEGDNLVIPSNGHFDTTRANIEANSIFANSFLLPDLKDPDSEEQFTGNMYLKKFDEFLGKQNTNVPLIFLTITNNTGGGQPVSMKNIKDVHDISRAYNIPLFFDACRFAENAWFIKNYENGYGDRRIEEIIREMFSYVDGFTISFKKDGLSNIGGGLFLKEDGLFMKKYPHIPDKLLDYQIRTEGHPTYGGMSGRDIMALTEGLKTIVQEEYLDYRIKQVENFGLAMVGWGLPVLVPFGGHAVYLDMNRFFADTKLNASDFGGISFTALLLAVFGHRACELGNFAFGTFDKKTGKETFPEMNFVRFAVPRLRYERQDLESVAEAVKILYEHRHEIPGVDVVHGKEKTLRHFKARFKFKT